MAKDGFNCSALAVVFKVSLCPVLCAPEVLVPGLSCLPFPFGANRLPVFVAGDIAATRN